MQINFSGLWKANFAKSSLLTAAPNAILIEIEQSEANLVESILLMQPDGNEQRVVFSCLMTGNDGAGLLNGAPVRTRSHWEGEELVIESWLTFDERERHFCDCWSLSADGEVLTMRHRNDDLAGQTVVLERVRQAMT